MNFVQNKKNIHVGGYEEMLTSWQVGGSKKGEKHADVLRV